MIILIPGATTVERVDEDLKQVQMLEEDTKEFDEALSRIEIKEGRVWGGKLAGMMDGYVGFVEG